jgi:hypothetical protein
MDKLVMSRVEKLQQLVRSYGGVEEADDCLLRPKIVLTFNKVIVPPLTKIFVDFPLIPAGTELEATGREDVFDRGVPALQTPYRVPSEDLQRLLPGDCRRKEAAHAHVHSARPRGVRMRMFVYLLFTVHVLNRREENEKP